jgi:hypothetical protein
MRPLLRTIALATLTACASTGGTAGSPAQTESRLGIYEFSAIVEGRPISGRLHVRPDTILVESPNGDCGQATSDARFFNVGCRGTEVLTSAENRVVSGAILKFDRGNPAQGAKWAGNMPVRKRREVCARYEVRNGREVCAGMKTETYETTEPRSGPVQMRKVQ